MSTLARSGGRGDGPGMTTSRLPPLLLIGCGKMGSAILQGLRADPASAPESVSIVDPGAPEIDDAAVVSDIASVSGFTAGVVLIAVKPALVASLLPDLRQFAGPATVFISIAAGVGLMAIEAGLGEGASVIRAMPNTPAAVLRGMTGAVAGRGVTAEQRTLCDRVLGAVGDVAWVDDEALIDVVTAVSGSGPAYFFRLAEALAHAGTEAGLPSEIAEQLARRTLEGAGYLAAASEEPMASLRQNVTSPGGTTAAGLAALDKNGALDTLAQDVVNAAAARSRELGG